MSQNFPGVAAAVQGMDESTLEALVTPGSTDAHLAPEAGFRRAESSSTIKAGTSPGGDAAQAGVLPQDPSEDKPVIKPRSSSKPKIRRASEGAYLSKTEKRRQSGEVKCEKCGKGYKHSSCLTKHLLVAPHLVITPFRSHRESRNRNHTIPNHRRQFLHEVMLT